MRVVGRISDVLQAVVEAADQPVEQVAQCCRVWVAGVASSLVVGSGAG
jgi:hypothetical protein